MFKNFHLICIILVVINFLSAMGVSLDKKGIHVDGIVITKQNRHTLLNVIII